MFTRALRRPSVVLLLVVSLLLGLAAFGAAQASNGGIVVNTFGDPSPANDGVCSLREAIIAANSNKPSGKKSGECTPAGGTDTILIPPGVYTLLRTDAGYEDASTSGDLDITSDLTIRPTAPITPGASPIVVVQWPNPATATNRIFHILAGRSTIANVTVRNGAAKDHGGGIAVAKDAALVLTNSTVTGNRAQRTGGGIYNAGQLTLVNVTLGDNTPAGTDALTTVGGTLLMTNTLNLDLTGYTGVAWQRDAGGVTLYALNPGSAAVDAGMSAGCPAADQWGVARPQDGDGDGTPQCDLGAFELAAPLAAGDSYTVSEDTALNQAAPGVLANDTEVYNRGLSAVLVSGPSHGALTFNRDGSFLYTPAPDFNGGDSFTYKVHDGLVDSNLATVAIAVTAVKRRASGSKRRREHNRRRRAGAFPHAFAQQRFRCRWPWPDHRQLHPAGTRPACHGQRRRAGHTPARNYNGSDAFTYVVGDGSATSNVAAVTVTVEPDAYLEVTNVCDDGPGSLLPLSRPPTGILTCQRSASAD